MIPIDINVSESAETKKGIDDLLTGLPESDITPDIDDVLEKFSKEKPEPETESKDDDKDLSFTMRDPDSREKVKVSGDTILKGSVVMLLINIAVPSLISLVHNKFNTGYEPIHKNDLKAPKSVLKELEPLADEVFKTMEVKSSPMTLFFMGLISTYGFTYLNLLEKIPKKEGGENE